MGLVYPTIKGKDPSTQHGFFRFPSKTRSVPPARVLQRKNSMRRKNESEADGPRLNSVQFPCHASTSNAFALFVQHLKHLLHILVPSAGEVDDENLILLHSGCQFDRMGNGMGALQGRQNALRPGQQLKGLQHLFIGDSDVFGAPGFLQVAVLRADAGIIQSRGDGIGGLWIALLIQQDEAFESVEHGGDAWVSVAACSGSTPISRTDSSSR